jgi:DNA-binding CsgD family transcriptional regulator
VGAEKSPPLNMHERAAKRRFEVRKLLLEGLSNEEIGERMGMSKNEVAIDTVAIYRVHGVSGRGYQARRALAAKLGVELKVRVDRVRERISELRAMGMKWVEIAREMGMSKQGLQAHRKKMGEVVKEVAGAVQV